MGSHSIGSTSMPNIGPITKATASTAKAPMPKVCPPDAPKKPIVVVADPAKTDPKTPQVATIPPPTTIPKKAPIIVFTILSPVVNSSDVACEELFCEDESSV